MSAFIMAPPSYKNYSDIKLLLMVRVNDYKVPSKGWLVFLRQKRRKTKTLQCF
jgi:hypothetical protein